MSIINARQFTATLTRFSKTSAKMRDDLISALTFSAFHFHAHNNRDPQKRLAEAANGLPVWLGKVVTGFVYGARDRHMTEEQASELATKHVMFAFMDKAEADLARKTREAARKASVKANPEINEAGKSVPTSTGAAKPSAGKKADTKPGPVTTPKAEYWLTLGDEDHQLTQAEAKALLTHLQAMRKGKTVRKAA